MRTSLAVGAALVLLLSARPAAAQLELQDTPPTEAPRGSELRIGASSGLRITYAALATAEAALDHAVVTGTVWGVFFQYEAWRILDVRVHLLQVGVGWSQTQAPEPVSPLGLQLGTGLRARAGSVSLAATALVGLAGWPANGEALTVDLGGELSIAIPVGCDAFELGYQALATASTGGFAEVPSQGLIARWTGGGETCREGRR